MAYEKTSVPIERSQAVIRNLIVRHGGAGVAFVSQPPVEGFHCMLAIEGKTYQIRIQAEVPTNTKDADQDQRRIWRVLFYHLKSVFEAADSGVLEFRELILSYIVTRDGQTIAQRILPVLDQAIETNPARLLPGPRKELTEQ